MSAETFFSLKNKESVTQALYQLCLKAYNVSLEETFLPIFDEVMKQTWERYSRTHPDIRELDQIVLRECERHVQQRLSEESGGPRPQMHSIPQMHSVPAPGSGARTVPSSLDEMLAQRQLERERETPGIPPPRGVGTIPLSSIIQPEQLQDPRFQEETSSDDRSFGYQHRSREVDQDPKVSRLLEEHAPQIAGGPPISAPSPKSLDGQSGNGKELMGGMGGMGGMVLIDILYDQIDYRQNDHEYRVQLPSIKGKKLEVVVLSLPRTPQLLEHPNLYLKITELQDHCHMLGRRVSGVFYREHMTETSLIYKPHFCKGTLDRSKHSLGLQILSTDGQPLKLDCLDACKVEKSKTQQVIIVYTRTPHGLLPGNRLRVSYRDAQESVGIRIVEAQVSPEHPTVFLIHDPVLFGEAGSGLGFERMLGPSQIIIKIA